MSGMESQSAPTTRLVRGRHGRMIAGVCQGIADHFHLDPIVVRIVFVIATFFGGAGAVAYVAGWLLIPVEGETASMAEHIVREHRWGRIAGIVLIVIAVSSLARPLWWIHGGVVFAALLIIGGLYLLSPASTGPESPAATPVAPSPVSPPPPPTTAVLTEPAPAPAPAPTPRRPRRRRGGIVSFTLGLLFVGGGVVGLIVASGNSVEPAYVFAGGLIIIGAALVLTTWVGRGFVLVPLGVVLVALMSASTVIDVPMSGGVGRKDVTPLTLADLHDEYHLGVGELRLDLTHVTFDRGVTQHVKATVGVGHLLVRIPRNVVVELHGHAGMGAVQFLDDHDGGVRVDRDATLSAPGESVPHLAIDAEVGIGQVEVQDAAA